MVQVGALYDLAEQLLEEEIIFIRAALAADAAHVRSRRLQLFDQDIIGFRPLHLCPLAVALEHRLRQACLRRDVIVAELALIAGPLLVDLLVEAGIDALQLVQAIIYLDIAAVGAFRADRALGVQVPRARFEAIGAREKRPDRAELDDVAAELARVLGVVEGAHFHVRAALEEAELVVPADVLGEASAAGAVDAALPVEDHIVREGIGFGEVALLLDVAADGRAVEERVVLQRALAAAVADGAVEWVIDEQELQDAAPVFHDRLALRLDSHSFRGGEGAGGLRLGHLRHDDAAVGVLARHVDIYQAHAAVGGVAFGKARMVAEVGNIHPDPLGALDEVLAFGDFDLYPVDLDLDGFG